MAMAPRTSSPHSRHATSEPIQLHLPMCLSIIPTIEVKSILSDRDNTLTLLVLWGNYRRVLKLYTPEEPHGPSARFKAEVIAYNRLGDGDAAFWVPECYGYIPPRSFRKLLPTYRTSNSPKFAVSLRDSQGQCTAILLEYINGVTATPAAFLNHSLYESALEGLKRIHQAGILHDDIASQNLMVSHDGSRVWWIDFDNSKNTIMHNILSEFYAEEMDEAKDRLAHLHEKGEVIPVRART